MSSSAVVLPNAAKAARVSEEARARREAGLRGEAFGGSFDVVPARPPPEPLDATPTKAPTVRQLEEKEARAKDRYNWAVKHGTPAEAKGQLRELMGVQADLEIEKKAQADRAAYARSPEFAALRQGAIAEAARESAEEEEGQREMAALVAEGGPLLIALDLWLNKLWLRNRQGEMPPMPPRWLNEDSQRQALFASVQHYVDHRLPEPGRASAIFLAVRLGELARHAKAAY